MKAYRFYIPGSPLKLEDVPEPKLGHNDVLVKVKASGICGTDTHIFHGNYLPKDIPVILGHECSGIVEKIGEDVKNVNVGDRVCVNYVISCGQCRHCFQGNDNRCLNRKTFGVDLDGAFAEYAVAPARNIFKLPEEIPFEHGAIIGCAVVTPFHALRVSELQPGDSIAIFGLGGVGMHAVAWAKVFGASKIIGIDIVDFKLRLAKEMGADEVINASKEDPVEAIKSVTDGYGVDIAMDCAGGEKPIRWAIESVTRETRYASGVVVSVALPPPILIEKPFELREGSLRKSGNHTRDDLRRVIELVRAGRIDLSKTVTHKLPFKDLNKGLELLDKKKENVVRVVITQ